MRIDDMVQWEDEKRRASVAFGARQAHRHRPPPGSQNNIRRCPVQQAPHLPKTPTQTKLN